MLHHVKDLSPEQKHAAEILLGHAVSDEESLSIQSVTPAAIIPSTLNQEEREQAIRALDDYFAAVDSRRKSVTVEEEEAIINEAIRSVRPNYRPVE